MNRAYCPPPASARGGALVPRGPTACETPGFRPMQKLLDLSGLV
jgi:hypothetical protein